MNHQKIEKPQATRTLMAYHFSIKDEKKMVYKSH